MSYCSCDKDIGSFVSVPNTVEKGVIDSDAVWLCGACIEEYPFVDRVYVKDQDGSIAEAEYLKGHFNVWVPSTYKGKAYLVRKVVPAVKIYRWTV